MPDITPEAREEYMNILRSFMDMVDKALPDQGSLPRWKIGSGNRFSAESWCIVREWPTRILVGATMLPMKPPQIALNDFTISTDGSGDFDIGAGKQEKSGNTTRIDGINIILDGPDSFDAVIDHLRNVH